MKNVLLCAIFAVIGLIIFLLGMFDMVTIHSQSTSSQLTPVLTGFGFMVLAAWFGLK